MTKDEVVVAVEELVSAMAASRAEMRRAEQALCRFLENVANGEAIESLVVVNPPLQRRQSCRAAQEEVNRTRHLARQKVFAYALERGVSVTALARAWGISRQLASRCVLEASKAANIPASAIGVTGEGDAVELPEAALVGESSAGRTDL